MTARKLPVIKSTRAHDLARLMQANARIIAAVERLLAQRSKQEIAREMAERFVDRLMEDVG